MSKVCACHVIAAPVLKIYERKLMFEEGFETKEFTHDELKDFARVATDFHRAQKKIAERFGRSPPPKIELFEKL